MKKFRFPFNLMRPEVAGVPSFSMEFDAILQKYPTQTIVETMVKNSERPIIFPLSNPTSNCEALPHDIINWTNGRAIVASGSPFADVVHENETHVIGQGNNAFIFPGVGFATILGKCRCISDEMVLESAYALADYTIEKHADRGLIYPPVSELQEASIHVASKVLQKAVTGGCSTRDDISDIDYEDFIRSRMWWPDYMPFVYGKDEA